jgi:hypothetical protein
MKPSSAPLRLLLFLLLIDREGGGNFAFVGFVLNSVFCFVCNGKFVGTDD